MKYAVFQNPEAQALYRWDTEMDHRMARIGRAMSYFALNFTGVVREYQTSPEKGLLAGQAKMQFAIDRDKEALNREIQGASWLPDLPTMDLPEK
jgi:hypothetical protein